MADMRSLKTSLLKLLNISTVWLYYSFLPVRLFITYEVQTLRHL